MFTRRSGGKRYKVISEDGCGLRLLIPRYKKTNTWIGTKAGALSKGLSPKGSASFYRLIDGSIVMDGYLSLPVEENKVELQVRGKVVSLSQSHWSALKKEIDSLLADAESL